MSSTIDYVVKAKEIIQRLRDDLERELPRNELFWVTKRLILSCDHSQVWIYLWKDSRVRRERIISLPHLARLLAAKDKREEKKRQKLLKEWQGKSLVELFEGAVKEMNRPPIPRQYTEKALQLIRKGAEKVECHATGYPTFKSLYGLATRLESEAATKN